jgi:uncharacterized protein (DUF1778 family)
MNLQRLTVSITEEQRDLLDRLAALEGSSRSDVVRGILDAAVPQMRGLVGTFEKLAEQREQLGEALAEQLATDAGIVEGDLQRLQLMFSGVLAKLEGAAAAKAPASNTGATFDE